MISPSPGMNSPAETMTTSSLRSRGAGTSSVSDAETMRCAIVSVFALRRLSACALPRPSAIASAKFANNTVNQSQSVICNSNPVFVTPGSGAMIPRISCNEVRTLPTSTTNMTGLPIIFFGLSFLNESRTARLTICAFQIACFLVVVIVFSLRAPSKCLSGVHQQMLDDWTKAEGRKESQRSYNQDHANQQH